MTVSRNLGLTLVEVVIALAILAVGILAAFGMQASSLQGTQSAVIAQNLSNIAFSEIDLQRAFVRGGNAPAGSMTCRTAYEQPAFTCAVASFPCVYANGALTCSDTPLAEGVRAAAHQVMVSVTGPRNRRVELSTVVR